MQPHTLPYSSSETKAIGKNLHEKDGQNIAHVNNTQTSLLLKQKEFLSFTPSLNKNQRLKEPWSEIIQIQVEAEEKAKKEQDDKKRIRAQKYKEELDRLVDQHNQKKLIEKQRERTVPNGGTLSKNDNHALEMDKHMQKIFKDAYRTNIEISLKQREEIKERERQEEISNKLKDDQLQINVKEIEDINNIQVHMKKELMKNMRLKELQERRERLEHQSKQQKELDSKYIKMENLLLTKKEAEDQKFYDNIRAKSTRKDIEAYKIMQLQPTNTATNTTNSTTAITNPLPNNNIGHSPEKKSLIAELNSVIEQQNMLKEHNRSILPLQIKEKEIQTKLNKLENIEYGNEFRYRMKVYNDMELNKKKDYNDQKKEYKAFLDSQVQSKQIGNSVEPLLRKEELSSASIRNRRITPDVYQNHYMKSVIPNTRNCYERERQLNILDKWLVRPINTTATASAANVDSYYLADTSGSRNDLRMLDNVLERANRSMIN